MNWLAVVRKVLTYKIWCYWKFNIKGKFKLNSEITSPVQIDTNLTFSTLRAESVDNNLLIFLEN